MAKQLSIAVAGLGRMGARHALHLLNRTPRANLVAACTIDPKEREWAKVHLEPYGTTIYDSYDAMLAHPGLEAVLVATSTAVHAEFAIKAMEHGKHVLCEKPLSTKLEEVCTSLVTKYTTLTTNNGSRRKRLWKQHKSTQSSTSCVASADASTTATATACGKSIPAKSANPASSAHRHVTNTIPQDTSSDTRHSRVGFSWTARSTILICR